jgi:hypothetical protein
MRPQNFFDLQLELAGLIIRRKSDANPLATRGRHERGRDPGHLAGDRVALRILGQGEQDVDILAQAVLPRGGDEDAPIGEQRNVGGIKRSLFLDRQLDDTGARGRGREWRVYEGRLVRRECRACCARLTSASSIRPALKG